MGKEKWSRATEYLKQAVEYFSEKLYVYPYPNAINVGGPVGGMEFPGITFDWWQSKNKHLYALISHEIGHNWYPMIVGSDERRDAWMDEGWATFFPNFYIKDHLGKNKALQIILEGFSCLKVGDPLGVEPRTYCLRVNGQFSPGMRAHNCTRFAWVRSYVSTALWVICV